MSNPNTASLGRPHSVNDIFIPKSVGRPLKNVRAAPGAGLSKPNLLDKSDSSGLSHIFFSSSKADYISDLSFLISFFGPGLFF